MLPHGTVPEERRSGWEDWQNHVLIELRRLATAQEGMLASQAEIKAELPQKAERIELEKYKADVGAKLSALKVKAGIWGALGASIPTTVWILYEILNRGQGVGP